MGHGNMLLAVAGLTDREVKERTKRLAAGDWSAFAPAERQALAFAVKLSKRPSAVVEADVADLIDTFGRERAIDIIWYSSWVNFMTRFADAFQLPLERENVFMPPKAEANGEKTEPKKPDSPGTRKR
jgi:alkylhydroperoxidase family enzyme